MMGERCGVHTREPSKRAPLAWALNMARVTQPHRAVGGAIVLRRTSHRSESLRCSSGVRKLLTLGTARAPARFRSRVTASSTCSCESRIAVALSAQAPVLFHTSLPSPGQLRRDPCLVCDAEVLREPRVGGLPSVRRPRAPRPVAAQEGVLAPRLQQRLVPRHTVHFPRCCRRRDGRRPATAEPRKTPGSATQGKAADSMACLRHSHVERGRVMPSVREVTWKAG